MSETNETPPPPKDKPKVEIDEIMVDFTRPVKQPRRKTFPHAIGLKDSHQKNNDEK